MSRRFKNMEEVDDYLEKQINFDDDYKCIIDIIQEDKHEGTIYTAYDMCRKLNELYEENEQLQIENKRLQEELNNCEKFRYAVFQKMEELSNE